MSKKSKAPPMPTPPTYVPGPSLYDFQQIIPPAMTSQQILSTGTKAEKDKNQIDPSLSILESINPTLSPEARQKYVDSIFNYASMPQLSLQAVQSDPNVSSSQAQLGQQLAQGRTQAYMAGEDLANQRLQQLLSRRQSFFSGAPAITQQQNSMDIGRGTTLAELAQRNAAMQNTFNLGNFQNQAQMYGMGLQNQTNRAMNMGNLVSGGMNLLGQGLGAYFGGPGGAAMGGSAANMLTQASKPQFGGLYQPLTYNAGLFGTGNRF